MNDLTTISIPTPAEEPILEPRPPIILPSGELHIDNSSLEYFTTCSRASEYYLLRQRELNRSRSPLLFGGVIHKCLEYHYRNPEVSTATKIEEFSRLALEMPEPEEGDFRTRDKVVDTMISYLAANEFDDFTPTLHPSGQPFIEEYFELPLGYVDFGAEFQGVFHDRLLVKWCGRIDLVVEDQGEFWIVDHKTTSMLGETFYADFENSQQTIGYTWATQQILNKPVSGLWLNAIAVRKPSKTGVPFESRRKKFLYQPERLDEWQHNTLVLVSDFLSHLDRGFFPMETKWCVGKYGKCPYFDICILPPAQRETMLTSNFYKPVTWTPKNR